MHTLKAVDLLSSLLTLYPADRLIHGDLHYYNILKSPDGYKIIDPKGVIGHPILDLPRYILNEYWDSPEQSKAIDHTIWVVSIMSKELAYSKELLYTLLYIEAVMALSWNIESGLSLDKKKVTIKNLNALYKLIEAGL